jgi:polygalacturonase
MLKRFAFARPCFQCHDASRDRRTAQDDHVTILSGTNGQGPPAKNITVRHNRLGTGMGLSVGSSVAGGVEDVLYAHNWMNESAGQVRKAPSCL